jgi:acyl-CoA thioester hydrolase
LRPRLVAFAARVMQREKAIEIRWRDLDAFGHVNHVVFLTYLEEVRDEWLGSVLGGPERVWDYVIARVEVDYRRQLTLADDGVVARCGLGRIGNSSVRTREQVVTRTGELAAEAEAVLVAWDSGTGRSRPLNDDERAAFERAS